MNTDYLNVYFKTGTPREEMPENFAIITGYATTGDFWTPEKNTQQNERLRTYLLNRVQDIFEITGYDPETRHKEPGFGAGIGFDDACKIGDLFLQDAIFYIENDDLFVSYCEEGKRGKVHVENFSNRLTNS